MKSLDQAIKESASVVRQLAGVLYGQPEEACGAASTFICVATLLARHGIKWTELGEGQTPELMIEIYGVVERFADKIKAERN